jgi:hypothetical protein
MVTLEQYKIKYPTLVEMLKEIKSRASRIKDWQYDFSPSSLVRRIDNYISKMERVYQIYTTAPSYKTADFQSYIDMVEADTKGFDEECTKIDERVKKYKYT